MSEIKMRKCDNPRCGKTAHPESPSRPYVAPYGWLSLKGHFVGIGPAVKVEVCSLACLEPAVQDIVDEAPR